MIKESLRKFSQHRNSYRTNAERNYVLTTFKTSKTPKICLTKISSKTVISVEKNITSVQFMG